MCTGKPELVRSESSVASVFVGEMPAAGFRF